MGDDRDEVLLAQDLLDVLGADAFFEASARADTCRRQGDQEGVRFWMAVARSVRLIAAFESRAHGEAAGGLKDRALWRLMQRIEAYRYRADQAELRSAVASDEIRQDLIEIAREWRALAAHAELLVKEQGPDEG